MTVAWSADARVGMALVLAAVLLVARATSRAAEEPKQASPWEKVIQGFEGRDAKMPPPKGAILFAGSSSIVGWNLPKCFPDLKTINRGFGGSQIADSTQFAGRFIIPRAPKTIVFYAGDNDIASGNAPERVLEDYKAFVKTVHDALPETRIIFIAIKPSIARWKLWEKMKAANALIEEHAKADKRLAYLDIATPMLGEDGKPKPELLAKDGLHLSAAGYELWTKLLLPHLK